MRLLGTLMEHVGDVSIPTRHFWCGKCSTLVVTGAQAPVGVCPNHGNAPVFACDYQVANLLCKLARASATL